MRLGIIAGGFARIGPQHTLAIEIRRNVGDRLPHHPAPARRIRVVEREDGTFELIVKGSSGLVLVRGALNVSANAPACYAFDAGFDPRPVKNAQIEHAVSGSSSSAQERAVSPASTPGPPA
jgi:hypothetical protein